jgi:hypothetical protein
MATGAISQREIEIRETEATGGRQKGHRQEFYAIEKAAIRV